MILFDYIVEGYDVTHEERDLLNLVHGLCWDEIETTEQEQPTHSRYLFTRNGISAYYDYGADYYFFEEVTA